MSATPPPSSERKHWDPRALNLVQLQHLAERGSRRARAELQRRMQQEEVKAKSVTPPPTPEPARAPHPATSRVPDVFTSVAPTGMPSEQARVEQLQLLARQDMERDRANGPARFIGLVLMLWGALLGLGGLVLWSHVAGIYYFLCGLACAGVGYLLLRCRRWALFLHALAVLLALAWPWQQAGMVAALVQAAPVWIAGMWMLLPSVREVLD